MRLWPESEKWTHLKCAILQHLGTKFRADRKVLSSIKSEHTYYNCPYKGLRDPLNQDE